jgi:hypothetical protein
MIATGFSEVELSKLPDASKTHNLFVAGFVLNVNVLAKLL